MDAEEVLVSKKISFGKKSYQYFIGCMDEDYNVKPLYIMLPKVGIYVENGDRQAKWMYVLIGDDDIL